MRRRAKRRGSYGIRWGRVCLVYVLLYLFAPLFANSENSLGLVRVKSNVILMYSNTSSVIVVTDFSLTEVINV